MIPVRAYNARTLRRQPTRSVPWCAHFVTAALCQTRSRIALLAIKILRHGLLLVVVALAIGRAAAAEQAAGPQLRGTIVAVSPKASEAWLIDLEKQETVKTLPTGKGPHEVAVSPDGKRAAVSDYHGGPAGPSKSLTIIDIARAEVTKTIPLDPHQKPHGIAWLDDKTILCTSESSKALLVVDIDAAKVTRTMSTDHGGTHMLGVSADRKLAVGANMEAGNVSIFDVASGKKLADIPADAGSEGVAMSPDGRRVWTGNIKANSVSVIDVEGKKQIKTLPLAGLPIRVAFDRTGERVFVSLPQAGEVAVFDADGNKETARIKFRGGRIDLGAGDPVTLAMHPDGRHMFAAIYHDTWIALVDLDRMEVVGKLRTPGNPDGIAYSPVKAAS